MDPVILTIIGVGVSLAALLVSGQRGIRTDLNALSVRVTALDQRVSGLDQRLARLEGAFSVAFAPPRLPTAVTESPPASVTRPEPR